MKQIYDSVTYRAQSTTIPPNTKAMYTYQDNQWRKVDRVNTVNTIDTDEELFEEMKILVMSLVEYALEEAVEGVNHVKRVEYH